MSIYAETKKECRRGQKSADSTIGADPSLHIAGGLLGSPKSGFACYGIPAIQNQLICIYFAHNSFVHNHVFFVSLESNSDKPMALSENVSDQSNLESFISGTKYSRMNNKYINKYCMRYGTRL